MNSDDFNRIRQNDWAGQPAPSSTILRFALFYLLMATACASAVFAAWKIGG